MNRFSFFYKLRELKLEGVQGALNSYNKRNKANQIQRPQKPNFINTNYLEIQFKDLTSQTNQLGIALPLNLERNQS